MADQEVTNIQPPQILRERVRREHDAALAPRSTFGGLPSSIEREHLAELLKPETLRRNADSLPVLAAFQEFLDVERRRTRQRMLTLTLIFLLVFLIAGGVAGLLGWTTYHKMHRETEFIQSDVAQLRSEIGASYSSFRDLSNVLSRTSKLESSINREVNNLSGQQQGLSNKLAGLHSTITHLQNENVDLSRRLEQNASSWQMMTGQVDRIMALLTQPHAEEPIEKETAQLPPPTAPATPSATEISRGNMVLAIIPKDNGGVIDWRVPLRINQE